MKQSFFAAAAALLISTTMKRIAIALCAVFALTGSAHAVPTCHQRVVMVPSKLASNSFTVNQKVSDMVTDPALDFISATSNVDMVVKGSHVICCRTQLHTRNIKLNQVSKNPNTKTHKTKKKKNIWCGKSCIIRLPGLHQVTVS